MKDAKIGGAKVHVPEQKGEEKESVTPGHLGADDLALYSAAGGRAPMPADDSVSTDQKKV